MERQDEQKRGDELREEDVTADDRLDENEVAQQHDDAAAGTQDSQEAGE